MRTVWNNGRQPDKEALADVRDADKRKYYGLRHKPTGLWFHSEGNSSKRYFTSPDPFLRPKSACTLWRGDMEKPDDWEIVQLEVKIVMKSEGQKLVQSR